MDIMVLVLLEAVGEAGRVWQRRRRGADTRGAQVPELRAVLLAQERDAADYGVPERRRRGLLLLSPLRRLCLLRVQFLIVLVVLQLILRLCERWETSGRRGDHGGGRGVSCAGSGATQSDAPTTRAADGKVWRAYGACLVLRGYSCTAGLP